MSLKNKEIKTEDKTIKNEIIIDRELFKSIQPQGGISFKDEKYVKTGDGYETCIHIYAYPKMLDENWLATIMNLNNVVASAHIASEDMNKVRQYINKSVREHQSRFVDAKKMTDEMDSQQRIIELNTLYDEITSLGEIIKLIVVRLFVSGRTLDELDDNVKSIQNYLESYGYKASVFLNEQKDEWSSIYKTYTQQQQSLYKRYGQPLTTECLAGGNPFHFTSLMDPSGSYFGWTNTGGSVCFNMFTRTKNRKSYNGVAIGTMGMGKSTTLKKIMEDLAVRGDYIRCFDATGEYSDLVEHLGGKIISLDGSNGILNAMEILKTDENENICFARHLAKLTTIYKLLSPTSDNFEIMAFEQLIRDFYVEQGIIDEDENKAMNVTGLPTTSYPTWSNFYDFVAKTIDKTKGKKDTIKNEIETIKAKRYNNVKLVISNIVKNYGNLFDGHTSIENIMNTQIVCFNIANLKNLKTEVFDAQIFLAQSLWWDNCVRLGARMKKLYEKGEIQEEDTVHFLGIIDEAHTMINAHKTVTLDQLITFCREARKYFGGLLFASQSIRDFVPAGSDNEGINKIKTLFELAQYKFILRQDSNSIDVLNTVFQHQLTATELQDIPRLEEGECILSISGDRNIKFHVNITNEEKERFTGGA